MKPRMLAAIAVCAAALAAPAGAAASVTLVTFTSPVSRGSAALLVARVTGTPRCTIAAFHKNRAWHTKAFAPRRPSAGIVSWAWQVGAVAGRWRIVVSCGSAGSLTATLVVTA